MGLGFWSKDIEGLTFRRGFGFRGIAEVCRFQRVEVSKALSFRSAWGFQGLMFSRDRGFQMYVISESLRLPRYWGFLGIEFLRGIEISEGKNLSKHCGFPRFEDLRGRGVQSIIVSEGLRYPRRLDFPSFNGFESFKFPNICDFQGGMMYPRDWNVIDAYYSQKVFWAIEVTEGIMFSRFLGFREFVVSEGL